METFLKALGVMVFTLMLAGVIAVFIAWPVKLLWNDVMPDIFGLKTITFMQALLLSLLCSLLFKSSSSSKDK